MSFSHDSQCILGTDSCIVSIINYPQLGNCYHQSSVNFLGGVIGRSASTFAVLVSRSTCASSTPLIFFIRFVVSFAHALAGHANDSKCLTGHICPLPVTVIELRGTPMAHAIV